MSLMTGAAAASALPVTSLSGVSSNKFSSVSSKKMVTAWRAGGLVLRAVFASFSIICFAYYLGHLASRRTALVSIVDDPFLRSYFGQSKRQVLKRVSQETGRKWLSEINSHSLVPELESREANKRKEEDAHRRTVLHKIQEPDGRRMIEDLGALEAKAFGAPDSKSALDQLESGVAKHLQEAAGVVLTKGGQIKQATPSRNMDVAGWRRQAEAREVAAKRAAASPRPSVNGAVPQFAGEVGKLMASLAKGGAARGKAGSSPEARIRSLTQSLAAQKSAAGRVEKQEEEREAEREARGARRLRKVEDSFSLPMRDAGQPARGLGLASTA